MGRVLYLTLLRNKSLYRIGPRVEEKNQISITGLEPWLSAVRTLFLTDIFVKALGRFGRNSIQCSTSSLQEERDNVLFYRRGIRDVRYFGRSLHTFLFQ